MIHDIVIGINYMTPRPVAHPTSISLIQPSRIKCTREWKGAAWEDEFWGEKEKKKMWEEESSFLALSLIVIDTPMYVEYRKHLETWMAIQEKVITPRKLLQANQTIVGGL